MTSILDVAIIGAGPYGLSIAAHLSFRGLRFRIFGIPMHTWRAEMPPGMFLKSDGLSSDLADPEGRFTLKEFCAQRGLDYHETDKPIALRTFVDYGLAFQRRFVPSLETKLLVSLERLSIGFRLIFDDGDEVISRRVVLAVGIAHFRHIPDALGGLPPDIVSHSSEYGSIDRLLTKRVIVLGAGASALDLAALLHEHGADAAILTRRPRVDFLGPPGHRAWWRRLVRPNSGIGTGWRLRIFADMPQAFYLLPGRLRRHQVATLLGPSTGWFMKDRIIDRLPLLTGRELRKAAMLDGRIRLTIATPDSREEDIVADHVVAATGYKVDLGQLGFISPQLRAGIRSERGSPILSRNFESSVSGLFFVGPSSMNSFGPLVRFVYGARYTSRRLSAHLARSRRAYDAMASRPLKAMALETAVDQDLASP
jgi:hypothetical protein